MQRKRFFILGFVLFFILGVIFGFIKLSAYKNMSGLIKINPSPAPELPLDWKKYENIKYHFNFRYPPDFKIEELTSLAPNFLQVNLSKDRKAQVIIMVNGNYEIGDTSLFVGSDPVAEKTFNSKTWSFFEFPQGYSNSGPFTVFQKEGSGFLYSFKFYDLVSNELRDKIMNTVRITP